jgi:hypothetical protein
MLEFSFYFYFVNILTNTKFKHVISTHYQNWYLVCEFTFDVTQLS